jgi:transposase
MTIPQRLHRTIHTICTDIWDAYLGAAAEFIEAHNIQAQIVIDRFHVAKNYRANFDNLRKQELRRLRRELPKETYKEVAYGLHWVLRHNHANLDDVDKVRLRTLFQYVPRLHQAYTLREELTAIFNKKLDPLTGQHRLEKWAAKVERSGLNCFEPFLKTLRNHFAAPLLPTIFIGELTVVLSKGLTTN